MARINNHRANIRSKTSKKQKSKSQQRKDRLRFWRDRALKQAGIFERIDKLTKRAEKAERKRNKVQRQLEIARENISELERKYQVLARKTRRERNTIIRTARERWLEKEREINEKHEQERVEWMEECELHESKVRQLEERIGSTYYELFKDS